MNGRRNNPTRAKTRRTVTPKTLSGWVRPWNKDEWSDEYFFNHFKKKLVIDRKKPGKGYRHLLMKRHIFRFLEILPNWRELSKGLVAIVLEHGSHEVDGTHEFGIIRINAWPRELWTTYGHWYYYKHAKLFKKLAVPVDTQGDEYLVKWTESSARAYQLLHILTHELGHHHDRMTTRSQRAPSRGEGYAESYARLHESLIWDRYFQVFPE